MGKSGKKCGVLIVFLVFGLFLAGIFGLFFEMPRFYKTEMSLDFHKSELSSEKFEKIAIDKTEVKEVVSKRTPAKVVYASSNYSTSVNQGNWNHISVAGRNLGVTEVSSLVVNPGNATMKFRKMIYGHNSAGIFGNLQSLGVGSVFSVELNGVTTNYRVSEKVTFEKAYDFKSQWPNLYDGCFDAKCEGAWFDASDLRGSGFRGRRCDASPRGVC